MYWEEEYIHILIERNLVDVLSLLASTEARYEISALVDTPTRIEARHETRCEEATSTSLHSKKKEARKIEPPQINNECIEKALIQLTGAVMEVGYLLSSSIEDSRCWLRTANTLTYGPPHTVAKFPGVCARLKSVLCEGGWPVSSLKLVVLRT